MNEYLIAASVILGLNLLGFAVAYKKQTDKLTDVSYALGFVVLAVLALATRNNNWQMAWVVAAMVGLWAVRLGGFLLYRIYKMGKDSRFDDMRSKPLKFLGFWLLQAVATYVISLSFMLFFWDGFQPANWQFYYGLAIWGLGLLIETVADWQKFKFRTNKKNKGKWIESGLWAYSRHPNYFGEILVWYGLWLAVAPGLHVGLMWLAFVSPLFIFLLLTTVSGVPILEKQADKKWGKNKQYQEYKRRTSVLLLLPKKQ